VVAASAVALVAGYYGWFRDSSLVAVNDVKVEGVTSQDGDQIVQALTRAGEGMTTLHVQMGPLVSAASAFPTVASLSANASFPHGLTIQVTQRRPVALVGAGSHEVPVGNDGTLLPGLPVGDAHLPTLRVDSVPASGSLSGAPLQEVRVIAAAPDPLRPLITGATSSDRYGVVVTLRGGIPVRFGGPAQAQAKWEAASAVLADPKLTTVSYVDVRVPHRPAAGGAAPAATDPAAAGTAASAAP
jgi:cell division protein FtsQ